MTVLLTGGAGYIGSHVAVELLQSGYDVIIADNFYNSSQEVPERIREITEKSVRTYNVDIQNSAALEQIFKQHEINAVMHFAGYKAVGEAVQQPLKYYRGNLDSTLTLLETMGKYQVKNLIFSSSATVYGNPSTLPITEACPTGNIASPYGWTKYMIEQIITDYAAATLDFSAVIFRYFNPVGAHPSGLIGEAPNGTPNNLMPYITQVAMGKRKQLSVFGADYDTPDGTCIRDYIHIMDIAAGHTAALPFCTSHHGVEVINLGTGMGHSVLELISAFENATGVHIPFQIVGRRAGDIPACFASAEKAKVSTISCKMSATQETHFSRKGIQQTRSRGKRNATEENERCTSSLAAMRPLFRRRCLTKLNSFGKHEKESQRCFTTLFQGRYAVLAEHVFGRRKSIKNGIGAAAIMKRDTNVRLLLYQKSKFRNPSAAYTTS